MRNRELRCTGRGRLPRCRLLRRNRRRDRLIVCRFRTEIQHARACREKQNCNARRDQHPVLPWLCRGSSANSAIQTSAKVLARGCGMLTRERRRSSKTSESAAALSRLRIRSGLLGFAIKRRKDRRDCLVIASQVLERKCRRQGRSKRRGRFRRSGRRHRGWSCLRSPGFLLNLCRRRNLDFGRDFGRLYRLDLARGGRSQLDVFLRANGNESRNGLCGQMSRRRGNDWLHLFRICRLLDWLRWRRGGCRRPGHFKIIFLLHFRRRRRRRGRGRGLRGDRGSVRRKINAPVSRLRLRELHFHIRLHIREAAHFQDAADRILLRFQIRQHQHLARANGRRHPQHTSLRKHDHRCGLLFEWLHLRRRSANALCNARAMHLYGDFERNGIGAQMAAARFRLRIGLRNCGFLRRIPGFDGVLRQWCH